MAKGAWPIGSFYVLSAAYQPMRNTFLFIVTILECVRLKLVWGLAIHQPHPTATIINYLLQWLPLYVGLALQISLAVGTMFGLAKLSRSRELDSLHALGFSWAQLIAPIMGLTTLIVLAELIILGWLQPLSIYYGKVFVHDVEQSSSLVSDGSDMFIVDGQKTIMLDGISRDGNLFSKVFIYENFPDSKTVTTAGSKGQLVGEGGLVNQSYSVNSVDVMEVKLDKNNKPLTANTITRSYDVQGPLRQFGEAAFRARGASEFEWTMDELFESGPSLSDSIAIIKRNAEVNYRAAQLLFILLLPFIALVTIIEPKRNPGPLRFFVGLLIVLGFNQYLSMATSFSRDGIVPPILSIWVPFFLVSTIVFFRFYMMMSRPAAATAR